MAPDTRFFGMARPWRLVDLAKEVGARPGSCENLDCVLTGLAPLDAAGPGDLAFLDNRRYRPVLPKTHAGACLLMEKEAKHLPVGTVALITPDPYMAYAKAATLLYPPFVPEPGIDARAAVDSSAILGPDVRIEAFAVIGSNAEIGPQCWIEASAVIGAGVVLGKGVRVGAGARISHAFIGDRTRVYPGACIGQDGFGFAINRTGGLHTKVPQLGRVMIGADVEIGANTCIDRGAGPDTIIEDGVWIDNLVQIGHNVVIERGAVLVAQCGIAGSSRVGAYAALGGQVGVAGHLIVGAGARVAAQSGLMRNVPEGEEVIGSPALPVGRFMRQTVLLARMTERKEKSTP